MSGHNKFSNIKHKKEKNDAAKGKIGVFNENFFIPLDNVNLIYTIEAEGTKIAEGSIGLEKFRIAPQRSKVISIPDYAKAIRDERCVNKL